MKHLSLKLSFLIFSIIGIKFFFFGVEKIAANDERILGVEQNDWLFKDIPSVNVLYTPKQFDNVIYSSDSDMLFRDVNGEIEEGGKNKTKVQLENVEEKEKEKENEHGILRGSAIASNKQNHLFRNINMVMFFANWCPSCHRYAPTWVEVSREYIKSNQIKFNAFDCAKDEANAEMCRKNYRVKSYPTLYAFVPKERGAPRGEYFMSSDNSTYIITIPENKRNYDDALKWIHENLNVNYVFSNINDDKPIEKINYNLSAYATIDKYFTEEQKIQFYNEIKKMKKSDRWDNINNNKNNNNNNTNIEEKMLEVYKDKNAYLHDAIVGFQYLLRNWIGNNSNGLKKYHLGLILKTLQAAHFIFPGKTFKNSLNNFIIFIEKKLNSEDNNKRNYENVKEQEETDNETNKQKEEDKKKIITSKEWHNFMNEWNMGGFISPALGKSPKMKICKTVFCSPWIFFHFMTVGLYKKAMFLNKNNSTHNIYNNTVININVNNKNIDKINKDRNSVKTDMITAYELLEIIKLLIKHFFGCSSCRNHFLQIYDSCAYDRCNILPSPEEKKPPFFSLEMINFFTYNNNETDSAEKSSCDKIEENSANLSNIIVKNTQNSTEFFAPNAYELLIFWLWRVHNTVTVRTATEDSALAQKAIYSIVNQIALDINRFDLLVSEMREMNFKNFVHRDVRWPSVKSCPLCRKKCKAPLVISEEMVGKVLENELSPKSEIWDSFSDFKWYQLKNHIFYCYFHDSWLYAHDLLYNNQTEIFYTVNNNAKK